MNGTQYRRRGRPALRVHWQALFAIAGLCAAFFIGWFELLPRLNTARDASAQPVAAPIAAAELVADEMPAEQPIAKLVETDSPNEQTPPDAPDRCQDAMVAALGNARIEFRSASADIVPASRNVIEVLAALAHACPGDIIVAGHSDNLGTEAGNLQISRERAEAVVAAFIELGIDATRLQARGYGAQQPIAANDSSDGRARNRRIEMSLKEN